MSIHHLERIQFGNRDGLSLWIRWDKARMIVHIDPSPAGNLAQDRLIKEYEDAASQSHEEEGAMMDKMLAAIVEVGRSTFDQLVPPRVNPALPPSLQSLLFPQEFAFQFYTEHQDGEWILKRDLCHETSFQNPEMSLEAEPPFSLGLVQGADVPTVLTTDIFVLGEIISDGRVSRVQVGDEEMCAKVGIDLPAEAVRRELETLLKIRASRHADTIRVPKLLSLVKNPVDERIIGFLSLYIPPPDILFLASLRDVRPASSFAMNRRKSWALQVQETVQKLHEIGVAWGDGKASNVLIHKDTDDVWVVDFDGGWSDDWMEEELARTVERDEGAVEKIFQFLEV